MMIFCIGAQKAGTTFLYNNLKFHPQVKFPPLKELHYFDELYDGTNINLSARLFDKDWHNKWWKNTLISSFKQVMKGKIKNIPWYYNFFFSNRNIEWYKNLFPKDEKIITGDFTPAYSRLNKDTVRFVYKNFQNAKIIFIMRDPIARDWSHYKMFAKHRSITLSELHASVEELVLKNYNPLSDYKRTIENYTSFFSNEQILFLFYDEIVENARSFYSKVLDFLQIEKYFDESKLSSTFNKGLKGDIPYNIRQLLIKKHKNQIEFLAAYFEKEEINYPEIWLNEIEK